MILRSRSFALVLAGVLFAALGTTQAAEELVYLKKATREESKKASLAASGSASLEGDWYLIGPFESGDLHREHPPEKEIQLDAKYPGHRQEAAWQKTDFKDGAVHNLKRFKISDNSTCYLYRELESAVDTKLRVSLGSDDGIRIWVNGQKVFENDAQRPCNPDDDQATLPLKKGKNQLLIKITNGSGDWAYYFAPSISAKLLAKLDQMLDRDFPPSGEGAHYRLLSLPLPDGELIEGGGLAFRPDGKLYVGTRRGDIWLVHNPLSEDLDEIEFKPFARGLHEILGLTMVGNDLYLVQRPEITRVRDTDGDDVADEFTTINDQFGCSGDYHEYLYGPARDKAGNFFVSLNVGFGGGHQAKVPYRGFCLKISPDGKMTPWAYGLRSPNGINFSPDGKLYYTDNQGEWVASCKMHEIRQNEFYGHMGSVRWWEGKKDGDRPEMTPPVIWFPYSMSRSTTEPEWDTTGGKFGPFAGQMLIGELTNSLVMRAMLEDVKGRMQGAVVQFRGGFQCGVNRLEFAPDGSLFVAETNRGWGSTGGQPHGLQRVIYTGNLPFEIHSMKITPTGWDVTFTKPIDKTKAALAETYFLESYTYHHWGTYGSPEIEREQNAITAMQVSDDGLTVKLTVPERKKLRVYHLQLKGLTTAENEPLLHSDIYYTMNDVP